MAAVPAHLVKLRLAKLEYDPSVLQQLKGVNLFQIYKMISLEDTFEEWLQDMGLVFRSRNCVCGYEMKLYSHKTNSKRWECNKRQCKKKVGQYVGTFFENASLNFAEIFLFSYFWCYGMDSVENLQREFRRADGSKIGREATTDWKAFFREIPTMYYVANPIKIGGPGTIVEVDETFVSHAKYNRGKDPGAKKLTSKIFGGVERGTTKCFMIDVTDTKKETLWPHILNYILPGTNIMSDGLRSYYGLENAEGMDYRHGVVEHKYNFVDLHTGDHTQSIESNWQKFKQDRIKSKYGAAESLFRSYIDEYVWKKEFNENRMYELWKLIGQLFPCT